MIHTIRGRYKMRRINLRKCIKGSVFLTVMAMILIISVSLTALLNLSVHSIRKEERRYDLQRAFYKAETGLQEAMLYVNLRDKEDIDTPYVTDLDLDPDSRLRIKVDESASGISGQYTLISSSSENGKIKTLSSDIVKDPVGGPFNYQYFLNNWAWHWGSGITGNGDNRSNWDFDFRDAPTEQGRIYAKNDIRISNPNYIRGTGNRPDMQHEGVDSLAMPNLNDISYYEDLASNWTDADGNKSYLKVGNEYKIGGNGTDAIFDGNIYLEGTAAAPIEINGPVVVTGNIIIKGITSGQGTLYAGRNVYIADDLTYESSDGPNFGNSPYINTDNEADNPEIWLEDREEWVTDNLDAHIFGLAATENIIFGNYNSSDWDTTWNYLKNWGDESQIGADGIPDTADDGVAYDVDGDGDIDSAWYDMDEDGIVDDNYNRGTDINASSSGAPSSSKDTNTLLSMYSGIPKDKNGKALTFSGVSDNNIAKMECVCYTNHAYAGRSTNGDMFINGAIIAKDEAIIYSHNITFKYDHRLHSDFNSDVDTYIDLALPKIIDTVGLVSWNDIDPIAPDDLE